MTLHNDTVKKYGNILLSMNKPTSIPKSKYEDHFKAVCDEFYKLKCFRAYDGTRGDKPEEDILTIWRFIQKMYDTNVYETFNWAFSETRNELYYSKIHRDFLDNFDLQYDEEFEFLKRFTKDAINKLVSEHDDITITYDDFIAIAELGDKQL